MKAISEVRSYDDFRKMSFSDFFYALRANGCREAEASAKRIMAAIEPCFVPKILERRKAVILLQAVRKAVADRREEYLRAVRAREEEEEGERKEYERLNAMGNLRFSNPWKQVRQLRELQDRVGNLFAPVDTVKIKLRHLGFEELLDLMKEDLLNDSFTHVDALAADEDRCGSFLASLDEKIQQQATMDASRVLKGLYMLPLLEDDQDLIIYFGTAFHATFENIDAYTGLLYSSTYFDTDVSYLQEVFASASEEERASVIREARNNRDFSRALKLLGEGAYDEAALAFEALGDFKNSRAMMEKALRTRDIAIKEEAYGRASKLMEEEKYDEARALFEGLGEWRDAPEMADVARENYKKQQYEKANAMMRRGQYDKAIKIFSGLGNYADSRKKIDEALFKKEEDRVWKEREEELRLSSLYKKGCQCLQSGHYEEAERVFSQIDGYRDAGQLKDKSHELAVLEQSYASANKLLDQGDYARAAEAFAALADYGKEGYKDSRERAEKCLDANRKQQEGRYEEAERLMLSGKYRSAEAAFSDLSGYLDASERAAQASIMWSATQALAAGNIVSARQILNNPAISHLSATEQIKEDLQVLEEAIKQELDGSAKLEELMEERSSVNKCRANLRERAAAPVPSQIESDASAHAAAQARQALGQLGMFDFKARKELKEQLKKEVARQSACSQRIPIEMRERKKETEEAEEALAAREAAVERQITSQNKLIEGARLRASGVKSKYDCVE